MWHLTRSGYPYLRRRSGRALRPPRCQTTPGPLPPARGPTSGWLGPLRGRKEARHRAARPRNCCGSCLSGAGDVSEPWRLWRRELGRMCQVGMAVRDLEERVLNEGPEAALGHSEEPAFRNSLRNRKRPLWAPVGHRGSGARLWPASLCERGPPTALSRRFGGGTVRGGLLPFETHPAPDLPVDRLLGLHGVQAGGEVLHDLPTELPE